MAVVFAVFGILHFILFVGCILVYMALYKKGNFSSIETKNFSFIMILATLIGFLVTNHFAMTIKDGSVMLAIGYSIIPITQVSLLFFAYVYTTYKKHIKYSPLFLGICCSAPVTFLATGIFGRYYWELLGKNIYG